MEYIVKAPKSSTVLKPSELTPGRVYMIANSSGGINFSFKPMMALPKVANQGLGLNHDIYGVNLDGSAYRWNVDDRYVEVDAICTIKPITD